VISIKGKGRTLVILVILLIALLSGLVLSNGIKKQDNKNIAGIPKNAQELLKYKTPYVGDNVKVVNLINKLAYGDSIRGVYLQTKTTPYGIMIDYDFNNLIDDKRQRQVSFEANAAIVFALIGNVDSIEFKGEEANEPLEFIYSRAEVQKNYNVDLRVYSEDVNKLEQLLESLIFRVSAAPKNYALTMSSTPGINFSAFYYGTETIERVRFSTERGTLFSWDNATGKISEGVQTVELPYGKSIYWSPASDNNKILEENNNIVTVAFLGQRGKELGRKHILITTEDAINYTIKPDLGADQLQNE
jgi:hypothetical protein